jgi:hypothetical protein
MSFNEFKTIVSDFFRLVKKMTKPEQVNNGFKQVAISFLELEGCTENEKYQAEILLTLASRKHNSLTIKI